MRPFAVDLIRFPVLVLIAVVSAPWIMALLNRAAPDLSPGWTLDGKAGKRTFQGIALPPNHALQYSPKTPLDRSFEMEITLRIDDYRRIGIGAGPKEDCNRWQVALPIDPAVSSDAPRRINLTVRPGQGMLYEDGNPSYGFNADLGQVQCIRVTSMDSSLTFSGLALRDESSGLYAETLQPRPQWTARYFMAVFLLVTVLLGWSLGESTSAVRLWKTPARKVWLSQSVAVGPLLIFGILSFFHDAAFHLIPVAGLWFLFTRLAFFYRYCPAFGHLFENRARRMRIWIGLTAPAVFFVFFFLVSPRPAVGLAAALTLVNVPFAGICLLYGNAESVRHFFAKALLLLMVLVCSVEAGLRILHRASCPAPSNPVEKMAPEDLFSWAPVGFSSDQSGFPAEHYRIGSLPFRSGDPSLEKAEGVYRIAVMGGSNVWGMGIEDPAATFPGIMERMLNERGPGRYEVINAGQDGFGSFHTLVALRHRLVQYHPDLILFYLLYNDLHQTYGVYTLREAYDLFGSPAGRKVLKARRWLRRSRLYLDLTDRVVALRQALSPRLGKTVGLKETTSPEDFEANLEDIIAACLKEGIRPVFVVEYLTMEWAAGIGHHVWEQEQRMLKVAAEQNVPIFNGNRAFSKTNHWTEMTSAKDPLHLSGQGHEIVGRTLVDFLAGQGLLANNGGRPG